MPPLFGQTIYCPPDAPESFCTTKGEKALCPERLSSSTCNTLLPPLEEELLELDELELELEELLLELDDDELDELEELLDEELELDDELLELEELLDDVPPSQPMGASATTMSSIQTSASLLLKLCQPNMT